MVLASRGVEEELADAARTGKETRNISLVPLRGANHFVSAGRSMTQARMVLIMLVGTPGLSRAEAARVLGEQLGDTCIIERLGARRTNVDGMPLLWP